MMRVASSPAPRKAMCTRSISANSANNSPSPRPSASAHSTQAVLSTSPRGQKFVSSTRFAIPSPEHFRDRLEPAHEGLRQINSRSEHDRNMRIEREQGRGRNRFGGRRLAEQDILQADDERAEGDQESEPKNDREPGRARKSRGREQEFRL